MLREKDQAEDAEHDDEQCPATGLMDGDANKAFRIGIAVYLLSANLHNFIESTTSSSFDRPAVGTAGKVRKSKAQA